MEWNMESHPTYLWTLPMFHCNGWCFPWTIAAKAVQTFALEKLPQFNVFSYFQK